MSRQAPWVSRGNGILQVRVPLPFPLRWVNAYLISDDDGWTVLDPGLRHEASLEVWETAMRDIGISFRDIRQIVLTHHHPDHLGLAGLFQEKSGAPVRLSSEGERQMRELWGDGQPMSARILELFASHGMDGATLKEMETHLDSFVPMVSPLPEVTPLAAGETIRMGGRNFQTIRADGHAFGQLLFHDPALGDLFCGDQVLPVITPNVSVLPGFGDDPLSDFLDSLKRLAAIGDVRAFPGHRDPFTGFGPRCGEIIRHHETRLGRLLDMMGEPVTAFALCRAFFGSNLSVHQLRFAMGETLAHLVFLKQKGTARLLVSSGGFLWVRI